MTSSKKTPLPDIELLQRIEELEQQCSESEKKASEEEEKYLRCAADLQNIKRRFENDRRTLPQIGKEKLFCTLLPILDHASLALQNISKEKTEWEKGAESILQSILPALLSEGFEVIDQVNIPLDPHIHEVLMSEGSGEKVIEVLQVGYRLGERVVRAAKVKVG